MAIGHNSNDLPTRIDRLENLEMQRRGIVIDMQEEYLSAKQAGFNIKAMKAVLRDKMMTEDQRRRRDEAARTVAEYKHQLGLPGI